MRVVTLILSLAALPAAAQDFYAGHLQRGIQEYQRGQYEASTRDLRVAAFGLIESLPDYETAQIYLALAYRKLERIDEAALAADRFMHAEKVEKTYATLKLDPAVRAEFDAALPKLAAARPRPKQPVFTPVPGTPPPAPATRSAPTQAAAPSNAANDPRKNAESVIANDYTNALAHAVLANLGWTAGDWNAVVEHFSIVRTRRRLTNEESAEYYVALIRSGRTADAAGVRRLLSPAVLSMPIVVQATGVVPPPSMAAQAPAPAPAPAPVSRPAAATPQPLQVSPLVAIAKREPSETTNVRDIAADLIEADRLLREGKVPAAREAYLKLTLQPVTNRELALEVAKGLNRTSAFRASSSQYRKLYPLRRGEEMHMLYEAENRYELAEIIAARQILAAALPALPKTAEVESYREKIQRAR